MELKKRDKAQSSAVQPAAAGQGTSTTAAAPAAPAAPSLETQRQLEVLSGQVVQLETALAQKEEVRTHSVCAHACAGVCLYVSVPT